MRQRLPPLCFAVLAAGCAARPVPPPAPPVAVQPVPAVRPTPLAPRPARSSILPLAQAKVDEAKGLDPAWTEADAPLNQARFAETAGNGVEADRLAGAARRAAEAFVAAYLHRQARAELERSYAFTALTDGQLERQQAAAAALLGGDVRAAAEQLRALNAELERAAQNYTARAGDTLWLIAARPEVYNNGWLWPLIWNANRSELRTPTRVVPGTLLQIRRHPTVDEVAQALDEARRQAAAGTLRPPAAARAKPGG